MKDTHRLAIFIGMTMLLLLACWPEQESPVPTVTLPSSVSGLAEALSDPREGVRFGAAQALADMGPAAAPAVPALIQALSDSSPDVRERSAMALGEIGPAASPAVPALVQVMYFDSYPHARWSAALALGKIGPSAASAVPDLVETLDNPDRGLGGRAAWALSKITGNPWPDSEGEGNGFYVSENGKLLIVIAAREWWDKEGQYQDWSRVTVTPSPEDTPVLRMPTPP